MELSIAPLIKRTKQHSNAPIASDVQPQEVGSALLFMKFVMEQKSIVLMVQMNRLKPVVPTGFIVRRKVVARYYYCTALQYIIDKVLLVAQHLWSCYTASCHVERAFKSSFSVLTNDQNVGIYLKCILTKFGFYAFPFLRYCSSKLAVFHLL